MHIGLLIFILSNSICTPMFAPDSKTPQIEVYHISDMDLTHLRPNIVKPDDARAKKYDNLFVQGRKM
ncbi:hypothetical protein VNO77_11112 [Canavalia gladiata]|uniref:Uncharacterized protein n=1 Tax=Canavalia gladiata TaxID=3824 RepID=A0AAN9QY68_CANGL